MIAPSDAHLEETIRSLDGMPPVLLRWVAEEAMRCEVHAHRLLETVAADRDRFWDLIREFADSDGGIPMDASARHQLAVKALLDERRRRA